nr:uncharacterized protein LOC115270198 [Aedes albopictus]
MIPIKITIGSGIITTAHRTQVKLIDDADGRARRRMVVHVDRTVDNPGPSLPSSPLPSTSTPRETSHEEKPSEEPFRGFPECELRGVESQVVKPNRKRKSDANLVLDGLPRRSKRTRRTNHKSEFEYF